METLTLILFVLGLMAAGFLVTVTVRRDLKAREKAAGAREVVHVRAAAHADAHHAATLRAAAPHAPQHAAAAVSQPTQSS